MHGHNLLRYDVCADGSKQFGHTRCFIRDDTKRKIREARARLLLDETRRSLELLDNFMARVVHHLREPLHILLMSSGLVADKLREAQALGSRLQAIAAAKHLLDDDNSGSNGHADGVNESGDDVNMGAAAAKQADALADGVELVSHAEESVARTLQLLEDVGDLMRADADGAEAALPLKLNGHVDLAALGRAALVAMQPCHLGVACELVLGGISGSSGSGGGGSGQDEGDSALVVATDPALLTRALVHLLNNAAAATTSGTVTLRISVEADGRPLLCVEDTGPGLPSAAADTAAAAGFGGGAQDPVFERYHQELLPETNSCNSIDLDEAALQALRSRLLAGMSRRTSHTLGMGLSLTYQLVQALGGELNYETKAARSETSPTTGGSDSSGSRGASGTRFWFCLPVSSTQQLEQPVSVKMAVVKPIMNAAGPQPEAKPASEKKRKEPCADSTDADEARSRAQASVSPQKRFQSADPLSSVAPGAVASLGLDSGSSPHVLVVEDSSVCAKLICMQVFEHMHPHARDGSAGGSLAHVCMPPPRLPRTLLSHTVSFSFFLAVVAFCAFELSFSCASSSAPTCTPKTGKLPWTCSATRHPACSRSCSATSGCRSWTASKRAKPSRPRRRACPWWRSRARPAWTPRS